jgi:hypothetical protein
MASGNTVKGSKAEKQQKYFLENYNNFIKSQQRTQGQPTEMNSNDVKQSQEDHHYVEVVQ